MLPTSHTFNTPLVILPLAVTFRFFTSSRPMTEPDSLLGLWHTALACGGLKVLTCVPASGSEAACRKPEAPKILYCIFVAQFQYLPIFSPFSHRVIQFPGSENVSLSPISTTESSSCTLESLVSIEY